MSLILAGCGSTSGSEGTNVTFDTEDGVQLSGYLFGSGDVGIVLSHMYPADQQSWWPFARVLADKDYQTLAFDFRGYGDSGGERLISYIDIDVQAALHFLQSQGASKVFLVGAGMGGTASIKVASRQEVAGVITLSAPPEFQGLNVAFATSLKVTAPKLFIANRDDKFHTSSDSLFKWAADPKEGQIVDGDGHGTDLLSGETGPQTQEYMLDFLERYR